MRRDPSELRQRLLNDFQRDFPMEPRPFAAVADRLGVPEDEVISELAALEAEDRISRVGPVFAPGTVGVSTLAAMEVPEARLDEVARVVNDFEEVNHNYVRENAINLWFVVTAETEERLRSVLNAIREAAGIAVHDLRLEEEYRIDLGFDLEAPHLQPVETSP